MIIISLFWLVFAITFFFLGILNVSLSHSKLKKFNISFKGCAAKINGVPTGIEGIKKFVKYFNKYLNHYNKVTKRQHIISAYGFFAASITAFFSFLLTLIS